MTSPTDPDPTIRRRCPVPATRRLAGGPGAALVLVLSTLAASAAPRGVPVLPAAVVHPVADRSSDPLANAPLRGRVSSSQSMFSSGEAPLRGRAGGAEPAPLRQAPAAEAPAPADPAPAGAYGLRQRTSLPDTGPAPVRSVMPYNPPGGAAPPSARPPASAAAVSPVPASGAAAARGVPGGRDVAPIPSGEAMTAEPVIEQVEVEVGPAEPAPVAAAAAPPASGGPVWATQQPDGSLLLTWTVPGRQISDPFVVSIIGPDEHTTMRTVRTNGASWSYSPEAQLIDFGLPLTDRVCVRVRSASDGGGGLNVAPVCIQVSPAS
ncbi:hypothetical protein ACRC7T_06775 [Segnochrobactraceae bacterium EtOH-i3]